MNWIKELGPLGKTTIALVIYSLGVLYLTINNGIHLDAELEGGLRFDGYLGKFNWSLFILWWPFLAALVHLTWAPFLAAWGDMQQKEMLRDSDGNPATVEQVSHLCERMGRYRMILLGVAVVVSSSVNYVDTQYLRDVYRFCNEKGNDSGALQKGTGSKKVTSSCQQMALSELKDHFPACSADEIDIVYKPGAAAKVALFKARCGSLDSGKIENLEIDFNIAYLVHDRETKAETKAETEAETEAGVIPFISKDNNKLFNYAIYFQQFVAVVMAALALFQLALVCNLFWRLERAAWLNKDGLQMRLDPFSKLHEFGLESWNHAWNNVYWVFSLVLLVPIASKQAQSVEVPDLTQIVLQYAVPALIAAPMVATIIARQQRLPDLWPRIIEESDPNLVMLYHRQLLWPFDRNWASKLGIIVSFALLGYLLGKNVLSLAG